MKRKLERKTQRKRQLGFVWEFGGEETGGLWRV